MSCCGTATPTRAGRFFLLFHFVMMILVLIFHQASHIFAFVESQAFGFGGSCLTAASVEAGASEFQRPVFDRCLRDHAAWYLIFGEGVMFLGCIVTALIGPEAAAHALGAWLPFKLVLPVVLCFLAFLIPTQVAYGTSQFGSICALPVLVAVGVAVVDRGASATEQLNNANFAAQRATLNFNAPSSQRRLHIVLAVASLLITISFAAAQFVKYQLGHQIATTVVSVFVVLVATVISVFPSNKMSILSSGIVGVYVMTCNWLALLMDTEANIPSSSNSEQVVVRFVMFLAVILGAGLTLVQALAKDEEGHMHGTPAGAPRDFEAGNEVIAAGSGGDAPVGRPVVPVRATVLFFLFNLVTCMFLGVLITRVNGAVPFWCGAMGAWLAGAAYIWVMVAPHTLKNRVFT